MANESCLLPIRTQYSQTGLFIVNFRRLPVRFLEPFLGSNGFIA
jgi:hypothetical protein